MIEMIFLRNLKSILTFDKQILHEISLTNRSTIHASIVITILALFETIIGFFSFERLYDELILHGTISSFSIFKTIFRELHTIFYAEQLHIETNISLIISSFLMFYIFAGLFTYTLTLFINKLGGEIMPINCFRIIGLSFLYEIIFTILIELICLYTVGATIPWDILVVIPLMFQLMVIYLVIMAFTELAWWKVGMSIILAYFLSIILAFIIAAIIIKGIINDLFDYKPGLLFFNQGLLQHL